MFELSATGNWLITFVAMLTGMTVMASDRTSGIRLYQAITLELYSYAITYAPVTMLLYMLYLVSLIQ